MTTKIDAPYQPHAERTKGIVRARDLHPASIAAASNPTSILRLITLHSPTLEFKPGQWLDVHLPHLPQPGGFSIITPPSMLPTLQLSIRHSPENPAADWFWQDGIVGKEIMLRAGGEFVWPPAPVLAGSETRKILMIAGGVGVNPLLNMLAVASEDGWMMSDPDSGGKDQVRFVYSSRIPWAYLDRIRKVCTDVRLFETGGGEGEGEKNAVKRRVGEDDLRAALDGWDKDEVVCYVCGPETFTDFCVGALLGLGLAEDRVRCEKWW